LASSAACLTSRNSASTTGEVLSPPPWMFAMTSRASS